LFSQRVNLNFDQALDFILDGEGWVRHRGNLHHRFYLSSGPIAFIHCGKPVSGKPGPYNLGMADRVACSCVTCPKCGTWVVLRPHAASGSESKIKTFCRAPDCAKEFEFDWQEMRTLELPLSLFERGHFYRSELQEAGS
jgi:hypothetical protein